MSNEYRSTFIDNLILINNFSIDDFDNFRARVYACTHPLFEHTMTCLWTLSFKMDENNKLAWAASKHGTTEMDGTIKVVIKPTASEYAPLDMYDDEASEFIETLFPHKTTIKHIEENIFIVNGVYYNFDTMEADGGYIHFAFEYF